MTTAEREISNRSASPQAVATASPMLWVGAITLAFALALALWHALDHTLPAPDDSSYILRSFEYADLLKHPKFWRIDWWHTILTVNQLYPPAAMVFNGILRLLFGSGNWVNILSVMIFNALLTASVFGTTLLLTHDRRAALLSSVIVNLYPQTAAMFHGFALDAPLMSMISCGLFALAWWQAAPSWKRAVLSGLILGVACLTKQIATVYLIGPGLLCLFVGVQTDRRCGKWTFTPQILAIAAVTLLVGLPWLLTNLSYIQGFAHYNQSSMGPLTVWQVFPHSITWYARSLPSIMSPLLFLTLLGSIAVIPASAQRVLLPAALSAVFGAIAISVPTWMFTSLRYIAPVMIAGAIYTGFGLSVLGNQRLATVVRTTVLAVAIAQFVSFSFAPFPLPESVARLSEKLGVELVEEFGLTARDRRVGKILHSNPQRLIDWGVDWALETIDQFEGNKPCFLNILPCGGPLNGNTFELAAHLMHSPVRPTTSRQWTVMGDRVRFDPKTAMYYQWYLLKSGNQGNLMCDDESQANYSRLIDFVKGGGNFQLVATHKIVDGSVLSLYHQR